MLCCRGTVAGRLRDTVVDMVDPPRDMADRPQDTAADMVARPRATTEAF